jgi:hypothetical protein
MRFDSPGDFESTLGSRFEKIAPQIQKLHVLLQPQCPSAYFVSLFFAGMNAIGERNKKNITLRTILLRSTIKIDIDIDIDRFELILRFHTLHYKICS